MKLPVEEVDGLNLIFRKKIESKMSNFPLTCNLSKVNRQEFVI